MLRTITDVNFQDFATDLTDSTRRTVLEAGIWLHNAVRDPQERSRNARRVRILARLGWYGSKAGILLVIGAIWWFANAAIGYVEWVKAVLHEGSEPLPEAIAPPAVESVGKDTPEKSPGRPRKTTGATRSTKSTSKKPSSASKRSQRAKVAALPNGEEGEGDGMSIIKE